MPEIEIPTPNFVSQVNTVATDEYLSSDNIKRRIDKLLTTFNLDEVGKGAECVVVNLNDKPELVAAIPYKDYKPEEAKEIFYLQRIFSTLFPHNFPHFHGASGTESPTSDGTSLTLREKISGESSRNITDIRSQENKFAGNIKYPFSEVLNTFKELNFPVQAIDWFGRSGNYTLAEDGGVYYLDVLRAQREGLWDKQKTLDFMNSQLDLENNPKYTEHDKSIVTKCIDRLEALGIIKVKKDS